METSAPAGLPRPLSRFVGREREAAELLRMLANRRLLTMTGSGGCGKTRLALEVAGRHPCDAVWVGLAGVAEPDGVVEEVAAALGVSPAPGQATLDAVIGNLSGRQILLVLDNCEHLRESVAEVVERTLTACGSLTVLATSRAPLGVEGELDCRTPSLSLPAGTATQDSDAVALFVDRAQLVRSGFVVDADNAHLVAQICRRLDGIPLALELAAARLRVLSLAEVAAGLGHALALASSGSRSTPARQTTLRASMRWSHDLLDEPAQVLLRRLGSFVGDFSLEMARSACSDERLPAAHLLGALERLVTDSLVRVVDDGQQARYDLLEIVRQFAAEQLEACGEAEHQRDRHRDAVLDVVDALCAGIISPAQPEILQALTREAPNILLAIRRATVTIPERAARTCLVLEPWWRLRGHTRADGQLFDAVIDASVGAPDEVRAVLLSWGAWMTGFRGDFAEPAELAAHALALAESTGDARAIAEALLAGATWQTFLDPVAARVPLARCADLAVGLGDEWLAARVSLGSAVVGLAHQELAGVEEILAAQRGRCDRTGDRQVLGLTLMCAAHVNIAHGRHRLAREYLGEGIAAVSELGDTGVQWNARMHTAFVDVLTGSVESGLADLRRCRAEMLGAGGSYLLAFESLFEAIGAATAGEVDVAAVELTAVVAGARGPVRTCQVWARIELAELLRLRRDPRALAQAELALAESVALGAPGHQARAESVLARLHLTQGNVGPALELARAALTRVVEHDVNLSLGAALETLGAVTVNGDASGATRLFAAAALARKEYGPVIWPLQQAELDAMAARAAAPVEPVVMSDVVAWALRGRGPRRRPSTGWDSLTPAEVEVVRAAAQGLTNAAIGSRLFMSRGTVKTHLAHAFAKVGVTNRTQLASAAIRLEPGAGGRR